MFFLFLLAISTIAIAGSAAYFSVYGLAATFSGVFWSVVIMGGSLEAGKLIAASALYRHWKDFHFLLKSYLIAGILALMLLTSGGIFGYLSSGYQTDVLPLKQVESQIVLLTEEKARHIQRKKDIDIQISTLPPKFVTARIKLMREFQAEQQIVTERIRDLDKEMLALQIQEIKIEAHIGPITYIAKAFNTATDDATKWLVFLIIFAFDPMAVALTIALNVVIRLRAEEKKKNTAPITLEQKLHDAEKDLAVTKDLVPYYQPTVDTLDDTNPPTEDSTSEPEPEVVVEEVVEKKVSHDPVLRQSPERHVRQYAAHWQADESEEKVEKLREQYRFLKSKKAATGSLSTDDEWELKQIEEIFQKYDIVA